VKFSKQLPKGIEKFEPKKTPPLTNNNGSRRENLKLNCFADCYLHESEYILSFWFFQFIHIEFEEENVILVLNQLQSIENNPTN
jgi:hypothetical protein